MLPTVWPGDTLIINRVVPGEVVAGDIALFGRDRRLFAHRVVRSNGAEEFVTRGDSMRSADAPVAKEDLLGKVSFIVRDGKCMEPRKTPRFGERVVAALVRRSGIAARVVVGVHGLRRRPRVQEEQD